MEKQTPTTQRMIPYTIEALIEGTEPRSFAPVNGAEFEQLDDARKWLRENGEHDKTYRIVVRFGEMAIQ